MNARPSQTAVPSTERIHTASHGLDDQALDELAARLAPRLAALLADALVSAPPAAGNGALIDAAALAGALGVSRAFVYDHADELGVVRLGDGPRARLRFDLDRARTAHSRLDGEGSQTVERQSQSGIRSAPSTSRRPRLPGVATRLPEPGSVLRSRSIEDGPCR